MADISHTIEVSFRCRRVGGTTEPRKYYVHGKSESNVVARFLEWLRTSGLKDCPSCFLRATMRRKIGASVADVSMGGHIGPWHIPSHSDKAKHSASTHQEC
jgi:hypothetical protein